MAQWALVGSCPVSICDHLPASPVPCGRLSVSLNASVFLSGPPSMRVSSSHSPLSFCAFLVSSPHVYLAVPISLGFFLQLFASISRLLALSPPAPGSCLFIVCVFPSRSERLGHGEVFPLGECPASGPRGARPSLGVDLASCHPGPLEAVLPGLGKAGLGSVQSQAPAGAG